MNLRVDLLQDAERRSASVINPKSIIRISSIVAPCILLLAVAMFVFSMVLISNRLEDLETQKTELQKPQQEALALKSELDANRKILTELGLWSTSCLPMDVFLTAIQESVPERKIQFKSLGYRETITNIPATRRPARQPIFTISCSVVASNSKDHIRLFTNTLALHPTIISNLTGLSVSDYRKTDSGGDGPGSRTEPHFEFNLTAMLKTRQMH